jgi:hypothetical protein
MIDAFRRFVVGGDASGDRDRGRSVRERRSRRSATVELLEGRMLLSSIPHPVPVHLIPPVVSVPTADIKQQAAVDLFATLDSVRGSATVNPVEIAHVQNDISIIFATGLPSNATVTTFLKDYRAATVGNTLNPSSVAAAKVDLTAMLGSANVTMARFHQFFLTQASSIGSNPGTVAFDPSFNDVKSLVV